MSGLEKLSMDKNQISDIPSVGNMLSLKTLSLSGNKLGVKAKAKTVVTGVEWVDGKARSVQDPLLHMRDGTRAAALRAVKVAEARVISVIVRRAELAAAAGGAPGRIVICGSLYLAGDESWCSGESEHDLVERYGEPRALAFGEPEGEEVDEGPPLVRGGPRRGRQGPAPGPVSLVVSVYQSARYIMYSIPLLTVEGKTSPSKQWAAYMLPSVLSSQPGQTIGNPFSAAACIQLSAGSIWNASSSLPPRSAS